MSVRRNSFDKRCPKCKVNKNFCFCDSFISLDLKTKVTVIMHYREQFLTSNTAYFAHEALTNSEIVLRGLKDEEPVNVTDNNYQPLLLYPSDDAKALTPEYVSQFDKPVQLIVPDGSWRQARKYQQRMPGLSDIPAVVLPKTYRSNYGLRKSPFDGAVCTYEAIMYALDEIEGNEEKVLHPLKDFFITFVTQVLKSRNLDPLRYEAAMKNAGLQVNGE